MSEHESLWDMTREICDECCEPIKFGQGSVAVMLNDTGLAWAHYHRACHYDPTPTPAAPGPAGARP